MSGADYKAWLNELAAATTEDDAWSVFLSMDPPFDVMVGYRIRARLIAVMKAHPKEWFPSPAKTVDAWLKPAEQPQAEEEDVNREPVTEPPALAYEKDILARLITDMGLLGHVGEERVAKLVYLAVTSRLFPKIVSIAAKGPSSAGKSATVDRVLTFFPPEAYMRMTGMSERYLAYSELELSHRMIVVYEATGMSGEFASYLIRSLLSEGRIDYRTVETSGGKPTPLIIQKEGPAGLITTTTAVSLHAENETRLLSLPMDDTREQTGRVLSALAEGNGRSPDFFAWHQLQYWLADGERRVVIPYAKQLAPLIQPVAVRLRRDFTMVLALIAAHALLHRTNRSADGDGRILADLDDYAAVRELLNELLADTLGVKVSKATMETVQAVKELIEEALLPVKWATTPGLCKKLNLDQSSVWRRVRKAIAGGYLINEQEKARQPARIVLGENEVTEGPPILPDPSELAW